MSDTLTLYTNPMSRGQIVHWMLEETGVPYRVELVDFTKGEHKSPEFLKINPMGKLPTLTVGDLVLTECPAICAWLADAYPDAGLAPALDDPARATYLRWLFFAAGPIEQAVTDRALKREAKDKAGTLGYGTYDDAMATLEKAITPGPWILGDRFTAADLYVGAQISWGLMFGTVPKLDAFVAYNARLQERPARQRAQAANEELTARLKGG